MVWGNDEVAEETLGDGSGDLDSLMRGAQHRNAI